MLVKMPFLTQGLDDQPGGEVYVESTDISFVMKAFDRIHVGVKSGRVITSDTPKEDSNLIAPGRLANLPDQEKLDEWLGEIVFLCHRGE